MINTELLRAGAADLGNQFKKGKPFPWLVVDEFLQPGFCEKLSDGFPEALSTKDPNAAKKHKHVLRKIGTMDRARMTDVQRAFFDELNSPDFLKTLEEITGISPLYADPSLMGGGLHEIYNGGYLNLHTDFNVHPKTGRLRALNLIVYLNEDWKPEYEGYLELWPETLDRCAHKIAPLINRAVLFQTNEISFHGHPEPLNMPEGRTRRSLAVYYYTDWPANLHRREKTNYKLTAKQRTILQERVESLIASGVTDIEQIVTRIPEFQESDVKAFHKKHVAAKTPTPKPGALKSWIKKLWQERGKTT